MTSTRKHKKNLIVSYKNLPDNIKDLFKEMYPDGYNSHLIKFIKPNGDPIFVVPLETDDTAYMVKFDVQIDPLGSDLDKALFDDDNDDKEDDFAPLSEAIEKEEETTTHRERVLRHGDFETSLDEAQKKKLTLGINKEEIKAALGDDEADELDSYEKIGDDDGPSDDYEPTDEDLRDIEAEYLEAENPPLDATIPEEEMVAPQKPTAPTKAAKATVKKTKAKTSTTKKTKTETNTTKKNKKK